MTQLYRCIIITVSNQSMTNLPKLTNLPKFFIQFQKQTLFKHMISICSK